MDIFVATAKDDLTAIANKMAGAIDHLEGKVKKATEASKKFNQNLLDKGLKKSEQLLRSGLISVNDYRKALINAGVAASRADQIIARMPAALRATQRAQAQYNREVQNSEKALNKFIAASQRSARAAERDAERSARAYERESARVLRAKEREARVAARTAAAQRAERFQFVGQAGNWAKYSAVGAGVGALYAGERALAYGVDKSADLIHLVVDAVQERQNTMVALKDSLKGAEETRQKDAQTLYDAIVQMAIKTPLDTPFLLERMQELIVQGWKPQETLHLMKMVADQESEFHNGAGQLMANFFARIRGAGVVTLRDMFTLQAAKVQLEPLYDALANKLGIRGETAAMAKSRRSKATTIGVGAKHSDEMMDARQARVAAVRKAISGRLVTPEMMVSALTEAHVERHGGLGVFAEKAQHTLGGAISNWKNMFGDMLKMTDITKWKGVESLTNFLIRAQAIITDKSGTGGELIKSIEGFFNVVVGGLDRLDDAAIKRFLNMLIEKLDWAKEKAALIWDYIDRISHARNADAALNEFLKGMGHMLWEAGRLVGQGIRAGILGFEYLEKSELPGGMHLQSSVDQGPMAGMNYNLDLDSASGQALIAEERAKWIAAHQAEINSFWGATIPNDRELFRQAVAGGSPAIQARSIPDSVSAAQTPVGRSGLIWNGHNYVTIQVPEGGASAAQIADAVNQSGARGMISTCEQMSCERN